MPVNLQWRNGHGLLGCFPGRRNGQQDSGELDVWTVEIAPEGLGRPKVSLVFVGAWIHVDSRIYSPINRSKSGRSRYLKASSYWKKWEFSFSQKVSLVFPAFFNGYTSFPAFCKGIYEYFSFPACFHWIFAIFRESDFFSQDFQTQTKLRASSFFQAALWRFPSHKAFPETDSKLSGR